MHSQDKFTLYWLDESRTHRILWTLELLDLDYEVDIFLRHPETWRGPPELFQVHPLGKAPILEIKFADGRPDLQLAESGLIMQYLLKNYDPDHLLYPKDERQQIMVDYYLHYAEGTLQSINISMLINSLAKRIAPFGMKTFAKILSKGLNYGYYLHEWRLNMEYLDNQLRKEATGFFVGSKLSGADIMLSFPVYENLFDNEVGTKECTGETDLYKKYPNLGAWCDKIKHNPDYKRITALMREKVNELYSSKQNKRSFQK